MVSWAEAVVVVSEIGTADVSLAPAPWVAVVTVAVSVTTGSADAEVAGGVFDSPEQKVRNWANLGSM